MNSNIRRIFPVSLVAGAALLSICVDLHAQLLVSRSSGNLGPGYGFNSHGYGLSSWDKFTAEINAAFSNQVTVVANFNNLTQMLSYDALLLDQRWAEGTLGAEEAANISTFAATGRRVLMIGENHYWENWNNSILAIVGGSFAGDSDGLVSRQETNSITIGVPRLWPRVPGVAHVAVGSAVLYDPNFATLWGSRHNVLTVLDVNVWEDDLWNVENGGVFGRNVAVWLAAGPQVPEPSSMAIVAVGASLYIVFAGCPRSHASTAAPFFDESLAE